MFPLRLICISNLKLVHSILSLSHSLALSLFLSQTHIWVIFYWFPFSLHFLLVYIFFYSVFCFRPSLPLSFSLTYSYCFLSLIFCFSLLDRTLQACVILALHVPLKTKTHLPSKTDNDLLLTVWLSDMQSWYFCKTWHYWRTHRAY